MSAVQLKLYLQPQGTIRRFTVDESTAFEQFYEQVKSFYPQQVETLGFQYLDDEDDLVSFSSNHEWSTAITNHLESKTGLLRIKVRPTAVRRPRPQHCQRPWFFGQHPQHCQRRQSQEQDVEAYINRVTPFLKQFGIEIEREEQKPEEKPEPSQNEEKEVEAFINNAAPFFKQLFGIDIQLEKENDNPQEQPIEKKEEAIKQAEEVEEIIIPEDDEPVEQVIADVEPSEAPAVETKSVEKESPVESKPVVQVPVEEKYSRELETLSDLGFKNDKLNKHLLNNFDGDLKRVVSSLVQLSIKQ
jgi:hypothetical protein